MRWRDRWPTRSRSCSVADTGPYPEVVAFYGRGSDDGVFIETLTTLTADPAVDDPRAIEICGAVAAT